MVKSICLGGRELPWTVQHSPRLKKIHIGVHPQEGIVLRAPLGLTSAELTDILVKNQEWLLTRVEELSRRCPPREYGDGQILPYLGGEVVMRLHPGHGQPRGYWQGDQIDIFLEPGQQTRDKVRDCLRRLYLERAKEWFPPRVAELNGLHFRHRINRVTVKSQATILGSCSNRGNLNFTWRLLLAPLAVVDYVIIHELAHMLEMNHTRRFWEVVEGVCPQYRRHLAWLKDMAATLYI